MPGINLEGEIPISGSLEYELNPVDVKVLGEFEVLKRWQSQEGAVYIKGDTVKLRYIDVQNIEVRNAFDEYFRPLNDEATAVMAKGLGLLPEKKEEPSPSWWEALKSKLTGG